MLLDPYRFGAGGGGGGAVPFANVKLLLHNDGTNGSTTFVDSSAAARTVSFAGTVSLSTTSPKFGTASASFTPAARVHVPQSTDFDLGTSDFCFEAQIYFAALPTGGVPATIFSKWDGTANAYRCTIDSTGQTNFRYYVSAVESSYVFSTFAFVTSTWYHFALARQSGTLRLFVDGAHISSNTVSAANDAVSTTFSVGCLDNGGSPVNGIDGKIDEFRFVLGLPVYTAAFSAPTAAFPDS